MTLFDKTSLRRIKRVKTPETIFFANVLPFFFLCFFFFVSFLFFFLFLFLLLKSFYGEPLLSVVSSAIRYSLSLLPSVAGLSVPRAVDQGRVRSRDRKRNEKGVASLSNLRKGYLCTRDSVSPLFFFFDVRARIDFVATS